MTPVPRTAWLVDLDGTPDSAPPVRLCMLGELSLGGWVADYWKELHPEYEFSDQRR